MTTKMAPRALLTLIASLGLVSNVWAQKPQLHVADQAFADAASSHGLAEVQLAKLAAGRSSQEAVRKFAARLEADHTKANQVHDDPYYRGTAGELTIRLI